MKKQKIVVVKDGPYIVTGSLPLNKEVAKIGKDGEPEKWVESEKYPQQETYALCRCGRSKNMPFCDGEHIHTNFDGTETADNELFDDKAEIIEGGGIILKDVPELCSIARFCHPKGGTWKLAVKSKKPEAKKEAVRQACNCPAGRLVAYDKETGQAIENKYEPSITLIEDPQKNCSGPIWVKGGVEIESFDGTKYEVRNRVTLCRCGHSLNKPFCDGEHTGYEFNDGDESLKK
ncbi:MAG: CDGSH iron-sulfur domain-containing protein [Endomicrobiaceae bacterium]|nr:CDGSH iron-sulfur domain-containing protein [Endomicrobiaceae bacterium]